MTTETDAIFQKLNEIQRDVHKVDLDVAVLKGETKQLGEDIKKCVTQDQFLYIKLTVIGLVSLVLTSVAVAGIVIIIK